MITFTIEKKHVDSGQFPIKDIKQFSINTGIHVVIIKYAEIINGKMRLLQ